MPHWSPFFYACVDFSIDSEVSVPHYTAQAYKHQRYRIANIFRKQFFFGLIIFVFIVIRIECYGLIHPFIASWLVVKYFEFAFWLIVSSPLPNHSTANSERSTPCICQGECFSIIPSIILFFGFLFKNANLFSPYKMWCMIMISDLMIRR